MSEAEARGIAVEIGAKRRLERKARPRSGSPSLFVLLRITITIAGTTIPDTTDSNTCCT